MGGHEGSAQAAAFGNLERHLDAIVGCNLILWAIAAALGHLARSIVIRFELDTKPHAAAVRQRMVLFSDWQRMGTEKWRGL